MRYLTILFLLLFTHRKAAAQSHTEGFNPGATHHTDSACFTRLCDLRYVSPQYWQVNAKNTKSSTQILKEWKAFYTAPDTFRQSGFLTIRFIVNCKNEPCCFYFYEMNDKYQPIKFSQIVKDKMQVFVEQLGGWKSVNYQDAPANYYYYLNFNIQNGAFKSVSP